MAAVRSEDQFLCSICLDQFTEPVTTPCGHNFCRRCLSQYWFNKVFCRCPLCKEPFHIKPELKVNKLLSELLSQLKQEAGGMSEMSKPGEVSCDHCSAPKRKAPKSCLASPSTYCESHLQPQLNVPEQKMEPVDHMEDRKCSQHHKPLEFFCRSDHSLLCTMCVLEHCNHEFVSLKEEFEQRMASLQQQGPLLVEQRRQRIHEFESSVQLSQREAETEKSKGMPVFTALMEFVQRSIDCFILEVQEKLIRTQTQAEALIQQLKQEICELEQKSTEAEQFQHSEDYLLFLQRCPPLPAAGLKDWSSVSLEPQTFKGIAARAVILLEKTLKEMFTR